MKTFISYDTSTEEDAIVVKIPELEFDCPKMVIGDQMSLFVKKLNGENILTPVKVTSVSIAIEWKESRAKRPSPKIPCAEQYVYFNPLIIDNNKTATLVENSYQKPQNGYSNEACANNN